MNQHVHVCDSLNLFAKELLPEFKQREAVRAAQKQEELAPYIDAALARKKRMPAIAEADIPVVESYGRSKGADIGVARAETVSDRGGGINIPAQDPHAAKR